MTFLSLFQYLHIHNNKRFISLYITFLVRFVLFYPLAFTTATYTAKVLVITLCFIRKDEFYFQDSFLLHSN